MKDAIWAWAADYAADGRRQREEAQLGVVMSEAIYQEGKAAKAAGKPDTDNPYRAGSQESLDWLEGYTADEPEPTAVEPGDE